MAEPQLVVDSRSIVSEKQVWSFNPMAALSAIKSNLLKHPKTVALAAFLASFAMIQTPPQSWLVTTPVALVFAWGRMRSASPGPEIAAV